MAFLRAGYLGTLVLAALAASPALALGAGTITHSGTTITYTGDAGVNTVTADDAGTDDYQFTETGISEASSICTDSGDTIACDDGSWTQVNFQLLDGNDSMDAAQVNNSTDPSDPFRVDAGIGNDTIVFPDAPPVVTSFFDLGYGGAGIDTFGLGGQNGDGADAMVGGPGNDVFNGGADQDLVGYTVVNGLPDPCTEANPSITVDMDGLADDQGCSSETADEIETDVERIWGSNGNDTITGGPGDDVFEARDGNDRLEGGDGFDLFFGGLGIDRVVYGNGCTDSIAVDLDTTTDDDGCMGAGDVDNLWTDIESVTGTQFADTITGSCLANTFVGSSNVAANVAPIDGDDTFNGDPAGCLPATTDGTEADFMGGGEGNDTFNGDGSGNAGFDTVTYGSPYTGHATSAAPCAVSGNRAVSVTFDDAANDCDGFGNTADNVNGDINRLIGSPLDDSINAAAADQDVQLFGRFGNDLLVDGPFNDLLNGEGNTDTANCPGGGTNMSLNNEAGTC